METARQKRLHLLQVTLLLDYYFAQVKGKERPVHTTVIDQIRQTGDFTAHHQAGLPRDKASPHWHRLAKAPFVPPTSPTEELET